jgi:acyl-CoA thioesterase FadM
MAAASIARILRRGKRPRRTIGLAGQGDRRLPAPHMNLRWLNALLWGNSVALSWMWGLGLFFSVQITFMFGLQGLLMFAIPNALGLMLFGFLTQMVAKRNGGGPEALAVFFERFSKPFRLTFYLYQVLALSLTVFALVSYLFHPLILAPLREDGQFALYGLYLCLIIFVILAAGSLFGEESGIGKIKLTHGFFGGLILVCIGTIFLGAGPSLSQPLPWASRFGNLWEGPDFLGYAIPLIVGLLVGPWLDLQHWQRAIQIHREKSSIRTSYFFGGSIFFLLLLFHGGLALWVMSGSMDFAARQGADGFLYGHDLIVRHFSQPSADGSWVPVAYFSFLCICILTTLDSGYVSLKWFLGSGVEKSQNMLVALVPKGILGSPVPTFLVVGIITLVAVIARLELEYFMVFYASFFVGYAALAIARCFVPNSQQPLPQIRMFSMASMSVVIFAFGFFNAQNALLFLGSMMPLVYVVWLVVNTDLLRIVTEKAGEVMEAASTIPALKAISKPAQALPQEATLAPQDTHALGGHFEGKWFVYSMLATYADTNSVGNVYFGMYPMYVGKTRELFFNVAMPDFDLKTSKFFILTRSFEHKFVREAREFDSITVKLRVADFNRKFCTLEHQIFGSENQLLGKGKQSLLFVSSKDYALLDIPQEVHMAFLKYT